MYDPSITFKIDQERQSATAVEYINHGMGIAESYEDDSTSARQASCNEFVVQWFENITQQGYERVDDEGRDEEQLDNNSGIVEIEEVPRRTGTYDR